MNTPIRVLVADDHALVREGIVRILLDEGPVDIVAEASDGLEAVEQALLHKPDVVVTDLTMPRLSGLEAVQRIHAMLPKCRILVLTVHHDEEYIVPIVEAGASGYLVKDSASAELGNAIRALARGDVYFGSEATKVLAEQLQRLDAPDADNFAPLTEREREVFHLIAARQTPAEIAAALGIALKTANNHRRHLLKKLRLSCDEDIVRYATQRGSIGESPSLPVINRKS